MRLFLELFTLGAALLVGVHAWGRRGAPGTWLFASLLALGWIRESYVALRDLLYGFPVLDLVFAGTPVIAAVIWAFSIYAALVWTEEVSAWTWSEAPMPGGALLRTAFFMVALACFYEPFLALTDMARWEEGTRRTLGVPWIALVGYPTLTLLFLAAYGVVVWRWRRPWPRLLALAVLIPALAVGHATALQALKDALGW